MPRANRYVVPGCAYHVTHRCHNRNYLLKFAKDRQQYRIRLREALLDSEAALLTYSITCNHVHLLIFAENPASVSRVMQQAAGEFARDYNRRKGRTGAFWEGRYHVTMIDSGQHLWHGLTYIELNMVRCGVVSHPREWRWSGYTELMGERKRNRLLDLAKLLELVGTSSLQEFREHFTQGLAERIQKNDLARQAQWTECLAVGSHDFVIRMSSRINNRQILTCSNEGESWTLREEHYRPASDGKS